MNNILLKKNRLIIAEAGVNYYEIAEKFGISLIKAAEMMIDEAKGSGCDAIKFQSYKASKIASKHSPSYWDREKEAIGSQYELFKKYDKFDPGDYQKLAEYCKSVDFIFLSTPFDFDAVDYLAPLMPYFKISSSDINNIPFIEYIAERKKPILLSTGASTIEEIRKAVKVINQRGVKEICLMHCILSYPTKHIDANLNMIKGLSVNFPDLIMGYSDHTEPDPNMIALTTAYLLGARVIEKHFTLDKKIPGNDHYHAADPGDFRLFINNIDLAEICLGSQEKKPIECEINSRKFARRSIYTRRRIKKGEIIKRNDLVLKRPGVGIEPDKLEKLVNKIALKDIEEDTLLTFDMIV